MNDLKFMGIGVILLVLSFFTFYNTVSVAKLNNFANQQIESNEIVSKALTKTVDILKAHNDILRRSVEAEVDDSSI